MPIAGDISFGAKKRYFKIICLKGIEKNFILKIFSPKTSNGVNMEEKVILVNKKNEPIGVEGKMKAHYDGKLHRAFSVVLFNKKGETLLQKRAESKYHSPGLWTNTCCSHPRPKERVGVAAKRRLKEEMGISCPLEEVFSFIYKVKLGRLFEHEFDHVFFGMFDGKPKPNKKEVSDWQWIKLNDLKNDIAKNPKKYTPWFKTIIKKIAKEKNKKK